ncbi:hypothetical protein KW800_00925 [Candidatus Parcubacteria bacterium]|nr:hypothetical protein [Candidatus Parcubacteria bacterium]
MNDDLTNDDPLVPHDDPIEDDELDADAVVDPLKTPHLDPDEESLEDLAEAEEEEEGLDLDDEDGGF